jgi:hypothetical protein
VRVKDSKGRTWRVGRRWLPWRRRFREVPDGGLDLSMLPDADDPITAAIGLVLAIVGLIFLVPALLVLLGLVLELALLLALLPLAIVLRVALRRPWTVQVVGPSENVVHTERVVGWRASTARIGQLAELVRHGSPPRPAE